MEGDCYHLNPTYLLFHNNHYLQTVVKAFQVYFYQEKSNDLLFKSMAITGHISLRQTESESNTPNTFTSQIFIKMKKFLTHRMKSPPLCKIFNTIKERIPFWIIVVGFKHNMHEIIKTLRF